MTDLMPNAHREARPVHTTVLDEAITRIQKRIADHGRKRSKARHRNNDVACVFSSAQIIECDAIIELLADLRVEVCREANSTQLQVTEDAGTPLV